MHGRVKVRTTAEQEALKKKERAEKLARYRAGIAIVFERRKDQIYDDKLMKIIEEILVQNPDIYTLWNIRREAFIKNNWSEDVLEDFCKKELAITESCLKENPKSYYIWHQRSWIMDRMIDPDWKKELMLCAKCLNLDDRNFHCWNYREFVVQRAAISPAEEFDFATSKILNNFSNYSSWHYRSRLLSKMFLNCDQSVINEKKNYELDLVMNATFTDPNDSSAWFYQRWLLDTEESSCTLSRALLSKTILIISLTENTSADMISLEIDDERRNIKWRSPRGTTFSKLWFAHIKTPTTNENELSLEESKRTRLEKFGEAKQVKIMVNGIIYSLMHSGDKWVYKKHKSKKNCNEDQLLEQLSSYKQLAEMEPNNKWAILIKVLLMRKIDSIKFHQDILESLKALLREDSLRFNYYEDLRTRFTIENTLYQVWTSEDDLELKSKIDLSGLSLTTLTSDDQFGFFEEINLGANSLSKSLHRLSSLQNCQKLSLCSNNLENLRGFPKLSNLRVLSLRNNKLHDSDEIFDVLEKHELRWIDLRENPVCKIEGFIEKIQMKYPYLDLCAD